LGFGLKEDAFTFNRLLAVVGDAGVEGTTEEEVDPDGPLEAPALLPLVLEGCVRALSFLKGGMGCMIMLGFAGVFVG
jgi:hypothetical protein